MSIISSRNISFTPFSPPRSPKIKKDKHCIKPKKMSSSLNQRTQAKRSYPVLQHLCTPNLVFKINFKKCSSPVKTHRNLISIVFLSLKSQANIIQKKKPICHFHQQIHKLRPFHKNLKQSWLKKKLN
jgi:hypothetical protein